MKKTDKEKSFITIPNRGQFDKTLLIETIDYLRQLNWTHKVWQPTPALIDKSSGLSRQFVGQRFDPHYFDLIPDGWTHDHCEICTQRLTNIPDYGEPNGYEAENGDWICTNCFNLFITPTDINETVQRLESRNT
jgi:hypothetical protein